MAGLHDRRAFLRAAAAAGAAWAAADVAEVESALAWASHQAQAQGATAEFTALTAAQAAVVDAVASRIIPSVDGRPGAHEAGVVHFVDRALATFASRQKSVYVRGIDDLNRRARRLRSGAASFASLQPADQDAILKAIEKTPFFQTARFDTLAGTFGLPAWGGNVNHAGWQLLGLTHQPIYQAPFGYYDAEANKQG